MALCDPARLEAVLDLRRKLQQSDSVGNARSRFAYLVRHMLLSKPELGDELTVGAGALHRTDVLTLDVFNQRDLEGGLVGGGSNDDRHLGQAREFRCPQPPFAGDQLIASFGEGSY